MLKIKVCGMTDQDNLKEILKIMPDYIGFIFYPGSPRYVGDTAGILLFSNIPVNISKTGVFVNEDTETVIEKSRKYRLNAIQLHGDESAEYCRIIHAAGLTIIKAFGISVDFDFSVLDSYMDTCDLFLFDTLTAGKGGSGEKYNWDLLDRYDGDKPFFLSGGIDPGDAESIKRIKNKHLYGIDVNSRFETSQGIKDRKKLEAFIKIIKKQDDEL
jgi:phosphoribosylanthranilate isomerase